MASRHDLDCPTKLPISQHLHTCLPRMKYLLHLLACNFFLPLSFTTPTSPSYKHKLPIPDPRCLRPQF